MITTGLMEIIDGEEAMKKTLLSKLGIMNAELVSEGATEAERLAVLQTCIFSMIEVIENRAAENIRIFQSISKPTM